MFEYKYWTDEKTANNIRKFICPCYVEEDVFSKPYTGIGYPVRDFYLDNAKRALYPARIRGEKQRINLRIRIYDNESNNPAFLEIKRYENDIVMKRRFAVTREGARQILLGEHPKPEFPFYRDTTPVVMNDFCNLRDQFGARGDYSFFYQREAYNGRHDCQVTFDRRLERCRYRPGQSLRFARVGRDHQPVDVLLGLRFTNRKPNWMVELVDIFGLS